MNKIVTVGICTLGCRVNQYESDALGLELSERGYIVVPFSEVCDAYIVNTCAVTSESDRKSRQMIRRCKAVSPGAFVAVCGCFSQLNAEYAAGYADYICGTRNKRSVIDALDAHFSGLTPKKLNVPDPSSLPFESLPTPQTLRTRAFVKIEDGCDNRCSYCVIPYARGGVVSRAEDEIIGQLETLAASGYSEAVLTGIETAAYGADTGTDLIALLERASRIEGIKRLRLGSLDPAWLRRPVAERLAGIPKLMPHLHLSVQSGSSDVLRAMKRGYNADILYRNIDALRENISAVRFSADIIVGFPGETDADFDCSMRFLSYAQLVHAHIFPYSKRAGTPAATMSGQIAPEEKARRARLLEERQEKIVGAVNAARVGQTVSVLFETAEDGVWSGHAEDFTPVYVKAGGDLRGVIADVKVTGFDGEKLNAELLKR